MKTLIAIAALCFAGGAWAGCGSEPKDIYFIDGGHVTKTSLGEIEQCANMNDMFEAWSIDGEVIVSTSAKMNGNVAIKVLGKKGLAAKEKGYKECYSTPSNKTLRICIK